MTKLARVVVVGLGPAGVEFLLPAARSALVGAPACFVRTTRHPAVAELVAEGFVLEGMDSIYESGADLDSVYARIAERLVDAAQEHGSVAYGVPGNPAVAERSALMLRKYADEGVIALEVVPGMSFIELAWARVGVDPMRGARVVDAHDFAVHAAGLRGPVLIGHCDRRLVLSDVKLGLIDALEADTPVTVLQRLGSPDERVEVIALEDLDRVVEPDHLTSVFVDCGDRVVAGEFVRLLELAERLRGPGGCPWDAEQTHHSLARFALEEAYEVVEAIERLPFAAPGGFADGTPIPESYDALEDELGDLLFQVVFHSVLASEAGAFTLADVARGVHDKLIHRHPHVFGEVSVETTADVMRNWEQIKKAEKGHDSIVAGITPGLPSLLYVHKLYRKAASVGLESGAADAAVERIMRGAEQIRTVDLDGLEMAIGEVLAATVAFARSRGVDAETSLRAWAGRFRSRFESMEADAHKRGVELSDLGPEVVVALWERSAP